MQVRGGNDPEGGHEIDPPAFSTDANAVLPLLAKMRETHISRGTISGVSDADQEWVVQASLNAESKYAYVTINKSFPLAACFSLLKVHGVDVTE